MPNLHATPAHPTIRRRSLLRTAAAACLLPVPFIGHAQGRFPARPLTMIVPLPAGSAADLSARIMAESMGQALGQPITVDNKPGGQFEVALQALASAPADGHTLMHINPVMCAVQVVHKKYDLRQLAPVGMMGATDMLFLAAPNAPFKTLPDMARWAQANPGKLKYGTLGAGSLEDLTMAALMRRLNMSAQASTFKSGGEGAQAVARDEVQVMPLAAPFYVQSKGKLVALAANNRNTRSALAPDAPTLKELQVDAPTISYWGGLAASPAVPPEVLAQLEKAMATAVEMPELRKRFAALGIAAKFEPGRDLQLRIAVDTAWMAGVAQLAQS